jgi:hypothetical protein
MTSTKNYTLGLVLTVSLLVAAGVQADMLYVNDLTTADLTGWSSAKIYDRVDGYINPTKNTSTNKYTSTGTVWDKDYIVDWSKVEWGGVTQGERSTWANYDQWISVSTGAADNKVSDGFYAFQYSLYAIGNETAINGQLNLELMADDYITAIYANGTQVYGAGIKTGDVASESGWLNLMNLDFSVDLIGGGLDLVFVVQNTDLASPNVKNNPMGLFVNGTLITDIKMTQNQTPEPATLTVLGLGLAGLGLMRMRRNCK